MRISDWSSDVCSSDLDSLETWRKGFGPIVHSDETIERVRALAATTGVGAETLYRILIAADRLAGAAMWTVVHMSYAERVDLSGAPLPADAFKTTPEGHTGGSLNMVPAFVGYLAANALSARTRAWLMGQGHSVDDRGGERAHRRCLAGATGTL